MRFIIPFCCAILTLLLHAVVAAPTQDSSPGYLKRKTYAALRKANEGMANASVKKHERLLEKKEDLRKKALAKKGVENFLKYTKESEKAGGRAESEKEKAKKRTARAKRYERQQHGV